jgi:hypothetical protein
LSESAKAPPQCLFVFSDCGKPKFFGQKETASYFAIAGRFLDFIHEGSL